MALEKSSVVANGLHLQHEGFYTTGPGACKRLHKHWETRLHLHLCMLTWPHHACGSFNNFALFLSLVKSHMPWCSPVPSFPLSPLEYKCQCDGLPLNRCRFDSGYFQNHCLCFSQLNIFLMTPLTPHLPPLLSASDNTCPIFIFLLSLLFQLIPTVLHSLYSSVLLMFHLWFSPFTLLRHPPCSIYFHRFSLVNTDHLPRLWSPATTCIL